MANERTTTECVQIAKVILRDLEDRKPSTSAQILDEVGTALMLATEKPIVADEHLAGALALFYHGATDGS